MARSGIHRWLAALVAVGLVTGLGAVSAAAQETFPPVDQPGVTDTEIKVGRRHLHHQPARRHVRVGLRRRRGLLRLHQLQGRHLRPRARARRRSATTTLVEQPNRGAGRSSQDDIFAVLPVAVLLFTGADLLGRAGIPTFGWNINEEWGSENTAGPPNFFGDEGVVPLLHVRRRGRALARRRSSAPRTSACSRTTCRSRPDVPRGSRTPSRSTRPRRSCSWTRASRSARRPQRPGAQMMDKDVDFVITCMDGNGVLDARPRDEEAGPRRAPVPAQRATTRSLIEKNAEFFDGELRVHDVRAASRRSPSRRA